MNAPVLAVSLVAVLALVACRDATVPVAADSTAPSVGVAASAPATAEASPAEPSSKACLMVNVCSCNLGCASIRVPRPMLREGTHTTVVGGALQGEEVKIVQVVNAAGATVLALTDLKHDHACSRAAERSLIGYGCASKDSGPVPANACAKGCD